MIELVAELYKVSKSAQEYLDFFIEPNEKELFLKYRDKVFEAFYPKKGMDYKISVAKQAINDFKKFKPSSDLIADLMLFYVETGVMFTNDFGDIGDVFYSSMEKTYESALELMKKENLLTMFEERAEKVVNDTSHIGWGFPDFLGEVFYSHYARLPESQRKLRETRRASL